MNPALRAGAPEETFSSRRALRVAGHARPPATGHHSLVRPTIPRSYFTRTRQPFGAYGHVLNSRPHAITRSATFATWPVTCTVSRKPLEALGGPNRP